MTGHDYALLAPEILLLAGAVAAVLTGSFLPRVRQAPARWIAVSAAGASATAALVTALVPAAAVGAPSARAHGILGVTIFDGSWALDAGTLAVRVIVPVALIAAVALARDELAGHPRESELHGLMLLVALGAVVLAGADDLLVLAVGFLLASIPMYALIGATRSGDAAEATMKTYLLGALLGVVMLAGVAVTYGLAGATAYGRLAAGLEGVPGWAAGLAVTAVLAGLVFKAASVPGHAWLPDAAQASPTAVAAFVSVVPKIGAVVAMLRLVEVVGTRGGIDVVVALVAAATLALGTLVALRQDDVRRLLGWSSVSQAGFLLIAVAAGARVPDAIGPLAACSAAYAASTIAAFAVAGALPARRRLADWAGAARRHPWLVAALVAALLSIVGTPPTALFAGKLVVFTAGVEAGQAWLVAIGVAASVASVAYALRWILACLRTESAGGDDDDEIGTDAGGRAGGRDGEPVSRAAVVVALGTGLVSAAGALGVLPLAAALAGPLVR